SGYVAYAVVVVVAQFALPFALLISRRMREGAAQLAAICVGLAIAHYVDLHFLLTVAARPRGPSLTALDVAAVVALAGSTALVALRRFRRRSALPLRDPFYAESLTYRGVP